MINGPGFLKIDEHASHWSLLNSFDFFDKSRRFPLTDGHLYVPDDKKSTELQGECLNLKELYEKRNKVLRSSVHFFPLWSRPLLSWK